MENKTPPNPIEIMKSLIQAMVSRTYSFTNGKLVQAQLELAQKPEFLESKGIVISIRSLSGGIPCLWIMSESHWNDHIQTWEKSRAGLDIDPTKALLLALTGGLDRFQTLGNPNPKLAIPGFPFLTSYGGKDIIGWSKTAKAYFWFETLFNEQRSWIGIEKTILVNMANRFIREPAFREIIKAEVLGKACGIEGMKREWRSSYFGKLLLGNGFVLSPCLLPEGAVFVSADPNERAFDASERLLAHKISWGENTFSVLYRIKDKMKQKDGFDGLLKKIFSLLPFSQIFSDEAEESEWNFVSKSETSRLFICLEAQYPNKEIAWEIFLPAELLNQLSIHGAMPWEINLLSQNADNLIHLFLSVLQKSRMAPPLGFMRFAGTNWAGEYFVQNSLSSAPPTGMLLSDLWLILSKKERSILVQNILSVSSDLKPILRLFTWCEKDPEKGDVHFSAPGFNRDELYSYLPSQAREEESRISFTYFTYDEYIEINEFALDLIWKALKKQQIELSDNAKAAILHGFIEERKAWSIQKIRTWEGPDLQKILELSKKNPTLVQGLQQMGAKSLALAIQNDKKLLSAISARTSKAFGTELKAQSDFLKNRDSLEGPDLNEFIKARRELEAILDPDSSNES